MVRRLGTNEAGIIRAYNRNVARHKQNRGSPRPDQDEEAQDAGDEAGGGLRIDKWLWCARFFKTRSVAQEAVAGGHVQVNGDRAKASRQVKVGDRLLIVRSQERYEVEVASIPQRRGPATEARQHYRETPESEAARAHVREFNRLSGPVSSGRPDKRERRDLMRFVKGREALSDESDED
jgi:ribosome-associated heat shock protein Hsp15